MITLTDDPHHPDLPALVQRWTADGEMKFRWPSDDEEALEFAAYYWTAQDWDLKDIALEAFSGGYGMKIPEGIQVAIADILKSNDGAAVEAFVTYWRDIPARNAKDIIESGERISTVLKALGQGIRAYKQTALAKLGALSDALSHNERWAWLPWSDDDAIDKNARSLIRTFDESMRSSKEEQGLVGLADKARDIIVRERASFEQIAKPLPDNLERERQWAMGHG